MSNTVEVPAKRLRELREKERKLDQVEKELRDTDKIARFLYELLDNIDTAEDMVKGNDQAFRQFTHNEIMRRFYVATTDGYTVTWKPIPSTV